MGIIFDSKFARAINGRPTFCSVIEDLWESIVEKHFWRKEDTQEQYISIFNRILIPSLCNITSESIDGLTEEHICDAIALIEKQGKPKVANAHNAYKESTIEKFKYLYRVAIEEASKNGYCEDFLWGTFYKSEGFDHTKPNYEEKKKIIELLTLKKSFSPDEEKKIQAYILNDTNPTGERFGILLMYIFGLRDQEACAVNFEDFIISELYESPILIIKASVKPKSNVLQIGGKTSNMPRIIPCPEFIYDVIKKREDEIRKKLNVEKVNTYPVACYGMSFDKRLTSDQLNCATKKLFRDIGIDEKVLIYLGEELTKDNISFYLKEKCPTAYLMRRNFATTMYALGLSEPEMRYIIGHDMEEYEVSRNDYCSPIFLNIIIDKMSNRIFYGISDKNKIVNIDISKIDTQSAIYLKSGINYTIHYNGKRPFKIRIRNDEIMNGLGMKCSNTVKLLSLVSRKPRETKNVCIIDEYNRYHRRTYT